MKLAGTDSHTEDDAHTVTELIDVIRGYLDDVTLRLGHHAVAIVADRLRERFGALVAKAERRTLKKKRQRTVYVFDDGEPIRGDD